MMIVVGIMGAIVSIGPNLFKQVRRFFFLSNARVDLQREAKTTMELITKNLRQAQSSKISATRLNSGQPYYSFLGFTDINGKQFNFYQNGKNLNMFSTGASTKTLSGNLRYLAFSFPRSDDMTIISVALTLEKSIFENRTKALHMASEKVRVMN